MNLWLSVSIINQAVFFYFIYQIFENIVICTTFVFCFFQLLHLFNKCILVWVFFFGSLRGNRPDNICSLFNYMTLKHLACFAYFGVYPMCVINAGLIIHLFSHANYFHYARMHNAFLDLY